MNFPKTSLVLTTKLRLINTRVETTIGGNFEITQLDRLILFSSLYVKPFHVRSSVFEKI